MSEPRFSLAFIDLYVNDQMQYWRRCANLVAEKQAKLMLENRVLKAKFDKISEDQVKSDPQPLG